MKYDVLAFIGRFQPFHNGHKAVIDAALDKSQKVALVLGSHNQPRSARNPFTTAERIEMISAVYPEEVASGRLNFVPQEDNMYSMQRWLAGVQSGVYAVNARGGWKDRSNIGLIGHAKDNSSFYLKCFPTWDNIEVNNVRGINATNVRHDLFTGALFRQNNDHILPSEVKEWLVSWKTTQAYKDVLAEHNFVEDYKKQWADSPYPPFFYTADAVVVQAGHILLVKRGAMPGEGLWALPGGFVNQYETSRQAAVRELHEETKISLNKKTLDHCITEFRAFEDPYRSQRGRTVTTAYKIELHGDALPTIKGSDDAAKAEWVPISALRRDMMFEDHFDICQEMVSF